MSLTPLFRVNDLFPVYHVCQPNFSVADITDNFAYIIDSTGWNLFKRNGIFVSLVNTKSVEGLPKLEEFVHLTTPKLPLDLIRKVTAFFAAVYKKNKSEAVGYLYYNPQTTEWDFIPPKQTATGASATYEEAPKKEGWIVSGTIHSHGSMSAFHSGTDHKDEKFFDGVHITIGKVDDVPEYAFSVVAQGERWKYTASSLIDGMSPEEDVPTEWMNAMKFSPPKLIDDKEFGDAAKKLYEKYLNDEITEKAYLKKLEALEEKAESPIIDSSKTAKGYIRRYDSRFGGWNGYRNWD